MEWDLFLKNKDIKVTKARIALLNILKESEKGISAEALYEQCKRSGIDINLSTIYRNLELFDKEGIIKKIRIGDTPCIYSIKKEEHNHILQCDVCNKSVKVPCPMDGLEELIKEKVGFSLIEHKLEMKGICEECKK